MIIGIISCVYSAAVDAPRLEFGIVLRRYVVVPVGRSIVMREDEAIPRRVHGAAKIRAPCVPMLNGEKRHALQRYYPYSSIFIFILLLPS